MTRFESSWDDGSILDLKLAQLLIKYDIPATFYIPSRVRELDDKEVRFLANHFEIGAHTVNHERLTRLKDSGKKWCEIKDSKNYWEQFLQKPVDKFCYPRGWYDDGIKQMVKDAGFKIARTTRVLSIRNIDPMEYHTTIHVYPMRDEYRIGNGPKNTKKFRSWLDVAKEYFDEAVEFGDYFHIWGHSWELEKYDQWGDLEKFLIYIKENEDLYSK